MMPCNQNFDFIKAEKINEIIKNFPELMVEAIKEAYLLHGQGETINPSSYFLKFPNKPTSRIIALPAYLGGKFNISGIKWISSNPDNPSRGLPRASALLILNDYDTGFPFACLEASIISATRTAISAILAAETLNQKKEAKKLCIVGSGLISKHILKWFYISGWQFDQVVVFDKNIENAEYFCKKMTNYYHPIVGKELKKATCNSDIIVFATTASTPYFTSSILESNCPIILNISLRDISSEIILASENIVDDKEHILNADTSVHLAYKSTNSDAIIAGTLDEFIIQKKSISKNKPAIFSPMGLGILDLAIGKKIYEIAETTNSLVKIPDFFSGIDKI